MRVFVTGATGFVGTAVVQDLLAAGHQVLGLARSEEGMRAVAAAGAEPHRGALDDLDSLARGARATDGVIHTAFVHDFSRLTEAGQTDVRAIEAMGEALAGSERPFVVTSAVALLTQGRLTTEDDRPDLASGGAHRRASDAAALALASRGVRVSLLRLPPSVHDDGDHGFVPALIGIARAKGVSAYLGDGANRWPATHRRDVARLYRLALERSPAGQQLHGVAEEGIPTRALAEAIGAGLGLPVVSVPRDQAAAHFGWLGHFFALDVPSSSAKTQALLGWTPQQRGLLEDLAQGTYFAT